MAQNFIGCDREQAFLMPPSLREWLPEDHLAWFVLEAVEAMDLTEFYADYRSDGHGRAAYEPSMMIALLLYAYATKQRSSRGIEIHCRQDIAYRVIAANRVPDHATVARFVCRHEVALGELFGSVLALCAKAGLVGTGVVAIDGTKLAANASREANLDYGRIAREIVAEAKATDEAEDELFGEARGDELPEELQTSAGRRKWLREAKQALEAERTTDLTAGRFSVRRWASLEAARQGPGPGPSRLAPRRPPTPRRAPCPRGASDPALTPGAASRVEAPTRGGACGRARGERGLRGLPGARDLARRAPLRRGSAEPLPVARHPSREDQHDRPRLAPLEGGRHRLRAGL